MKPHKTIRDPIHGNIPVTELELELIDTPQVQRTRRIKQNGLCYLVYPAMNSTRFEHSLGVMHLAGLAANRLELENDARRNLRIAGLLHDIGHCAFSHTSDGVLERMNYSHEKNSTRIVMETKVGEILRDAGVDPSAISDLINGGGRFGKIISSEIDVDKMDYLIRDAYYAGVAYGVIDLERIIEGIKMKKGDVVVDRGSLEAVESLLISRNMMYQTVYRHHTKRIVESMFHEALKNLLDEGKANPEEFLEMDDIDLVSRLRSSGGYSQDMISRVDDRRLFKSAYQARVALVEQNFRKELYENRVRIQDKIASDYDIEEGYLLLDLPEQKMSEYRIKVEMEEGLKRIDEVSNLGRVLEESEMEKLTFCIYAPKEELANLQNFNPEEYIEFEQKRLSNYM